MTLVLASESRSRARMLAAAGLSFSQVAAHIDEDSVKAAMAGAPVRDIADRLAEMKALKVSRSRSDAFVLGSDSMLALDRTRFLDKPRTRACLMEQLSLLRGRTHSLVSAACFARNGQILWRHVGEARLCVRSFSDAFLNHYVESVDEAVLQSVGGYHLEGEGVQLFEKIEGDQFTVRGLPLIPVLAWLREAGELTV
jgi:septum formation protein